VCHAAASFQAHIICVSAAAADPERQKECEQLLGSFSNERFAELVAIGKLINDFVGEGEAVPGGDGEGLDEDIGVAVEVSSLGNCAGAVCCAFACSWIDRWRVTCLDLRVCCVLCV
jgi:hypothetical protein